MVDLKKLETKTAFVKKPFLIARGRKCALELAREGRDGKALKGPGA